MKTWASDTQRGCKADAHYLPLEIAQEPNSCAGRSGHMTRQLFHSRAARTAILATALAAVTAALHDRAHADAQLEARYTISFARLEVGDISATVVVGDSDYAISARGRAGGIMKALIDGEGSFAARGSLKEGHPLATTFTSKIVSDVETSEVTMVLDDGRVKELTAIPPPNTNSVPVTETNRQGIVDPLTAMLFSTAVGGESLSQAACRQTLPIFDGRQRFDLKLGFKRMDKVTAEKGYSGPVVVCSVIYEPIAGHRSSAALVKYLSEGREMEMALAPIAGTRFLVPLRVLVVSRIANLAIVANRFEVVAQPAGASTLADPKPQ